MDASKTPLSETDGKLRGVDDYRPRAQIRKLYHGKEISSSDERKIEEFSRKYVVAVGLVREYILHLEHLDLLKRKREREESQKKSGRKEKAYKDYNWRQIYETRQIKGLRVFELDKYITQHSLTTMKLNKKDKVALVETHIAMTLFKELSAAQENPQEQEPEDGEDQQVLAEETILCEWEGNDTDIDAELDDSDLFCVCRGYEDGRFMICCDSCDEWYHGECIGIDETERKKYVETDILFICPFCQVI